MIFPVLWARGFGGFLLDLWSIARFQFRNPHGYTKFLQIESLRRRTKAATFVEAGTFFGVTSLRCARTFARVVTVELDEQLAARAMSLFAGCRNVKTLHGDAAKLLPELLQGDDMRDCLLFLDGHFSGGITACGESPEPAVGLLADLFPYREKILAIVVDDFRTFGTQEGVPRKSALLRTAEDTFGSAGYSLDVHLDQLILCRPAPHVK